MITASMSTATEQPGGAALTAAGTYRRPEKGGLRPLAAVYAELGHTLSHARRYAEAAQAFREAIREDGRSAELHRHLAHVRERQGRPDDAFQSYLDAVQLDPRCARETLRSAHNLLTPERAARVAAWRPPLEGISDKLRSYIYHFLGRAAYFRGDIAQAIGYERQALAANPANAFALEILGEVLWSQGRASGDQAELAEAGSKLEAAMAAADSQGVKKRRAITRRKLALALLDLGRHAEAIRYASEALALEPAEPGKFYLVAGQCYLAAGDFLNAAGAAEKARDHLSDRPLRARAWLVLARARLALQQYAEAVGAADQLLGDDPASAVALAIRAQAVIEQDGDIEQAARLLGLYAQRQPGGAERSGELEASLERVARAVERADDMGRRAGLYELQASLLAALGRPPSEVAEAFYNAGLACSESGDWLATAREVERLLRRALDLEPGLLDARWRLADSLLAQSYSETYPFVVSEKLAAADDTLRAGLQEAPLDPEHAWAYRIGVLINEQRYAMPPEPKPELLYEAVIFMERALLLDDQDAVSWAYLARAERNLGNQDAALDAGRRGYSRNPGSTQVLDEYIAGLADAGLLEKALELVRRRMKLFDEPWIRLVKAFILMNLGQPGEALALIPADTQDTWALEIRAAAAQHMGDEQQALAAYRAIRAQERPDDHQRQRTFAWAAAMTGDLDHAVALYEHAIATATGDRDGLRRELGLCYLRQGRLAEAERALSTGIAGAGNGRVLNELRFDLGRAVDELPPDVDRAAAHAVATRARRLLDERSAAILSLRRHHRDATRARGELTAMLRSLPDSPASARGARTVALAGLARYEIERAHWRAAAQHYQELAADESFPEAAVGLRRCIDGLLAQGDTALRGGEPAAAAALYGQAQAVRAALAADASEAVSTLVRLSLTSFEQGDHPQARAYLVAALGAALADGGPAEAPGRTQPEPRRVMTILGSAGRALTDEIRPLLRDIAHYWALDDALARWADEPTTAAELRARIALLRAGLAAYLDSLDAPADAAPPEPAVVPIIFDLSDALLPFVDPQRDNGTFINKLLPAMRDKIKAELGLSVPAVRARSNPALTPGDYEIQLDETPLKRGQALLDRWYFAGPPEALADLAVADHCTPTAHPVTGLPGCWLDAAGQAVLAAAGRPTLSTPEFLIASIDAALRPHLARFLGVQEAATLLAEWSESGGAELVRAKLPTPLARHRFTWLLKSLVEERVPIGDWQAILSSMADLDVATAPLPALVSAARLGLFASPCARDGLLGSLAGAARIALPGAFEEQLLGEDDGETFLAAGPAQKQALLAWLRTESERQGCHAILITRSSALRPLLRRLVAPVFPDLMVLAEDELRCLDAQAAISPAPAIAQHE